MTDPAVKAALALCILIGGVCASMLFRHDSPPADPRIEENALLRYRAELELQRQRENPEALPRAAPRRTVATTSTPFGSVEPPPSLARDYPEAEMKMMLPAEPPANQPRTHTVVDGDTLASLADRFLGSPARAQELFEANRDAIHDPALLRIGIELKIPPR